MGQHLWEDRRLVLDDDGRIVEGSGRTSVAADLGSDDGTSASAAWSRGTRDWHRPVASLALVLLALALVGPVQAPPAPPPVSCAGRQVQHCGDGSSSGPGASPSPFRDPSSGEIDIEYAPGS